MVEIGEDFTYFTYDEYSKMLDLMLFNLHKNTYISKEDIKQDLMIFILKLEYKIKKYKINSLNNIKGYIVVSLKRKVSDICKHLFKKFSIENYLDIMEYEYNVDLENDNLEEEILNKIYLNELFEYYEISKNSKLLLFQNRSNYNRNERYLLLKWIRRRVKRNEKWRLK